MGTPEGHGESEVPRDVKEGDGDTTARNPKAVRADPTSGFCTPHSLPTSSLCHSCSGGPPQGVSSGQLLREGEGGKRICAQDLFQGDRPQGRRFREQAQAVQP